MSRILVSGSIAYDRIMDFPGGFWEHLLPEKLHNLSVSFTVESLQESFGGVAGNIAYNLALLGEHPSILASAGNDFDKYKAWLTQNGIDTDSIQIEPNVGTATAHIISDVANNQIAAFYLGALAVPYTKELQTDDVAYALVGAGNIEDMVALPAKYRAAGIRYIYDPGQQTIRLTSEQLQQGITGSEAAFANDYEMEIILKKTGLKREEMLTKTKMLVTTLGVEGALITFPDKEFRIAPVKVEHVVDPTGAGDAHRAGFIKGILAGLPIQQTAQLASTVAAFAIEVSGTQTHRFTMEQLKERYHATYGETLSI